MNLARLSPILALMATAGTLSAQGALRAAPSGRATAEVVLTVPRPNAAAPAPTPAIIRVDYGQPHLRGRTLHTDSLVPYDVPWRLGANNNTTLTTDVDLVIGGATIPKGAYVLYTIPGRTAWTLVVQRSIGQGATQYPDSANVARIPLRHTALHNPIESLTIWLIPSTEPGPARGELRFAWGLDQLSTTWSIK
jgi:hypothetical protein